MMQLSNFNICGGTDHCTTLNEDIGSDIPLQKSCRGAEEL